MQINIDAPNNFVFITDAFDATEWPGIWAQVLPEYEVTTYDIWPDDIISSILNEGRTLTNETVIQYTTIFINGEWMTIGIPRLLYHFSPVQVPAPAPAPTPDPAPVA